MKKLFTLFAALCCVVFTAKAEAVGQKWYVTQTTGKMYELNQTYQSPAEVCDMPTGVTKVVNAIVQKPNGETKQTILYTDEPASDKAQLYSVDYDLESKSFGTPSGKFTNTDKIVPITAVALSVYNTQIYMAGYTTSDSKYRLLWSNLSNVSSYALLPSPASKTNPIVGMVISQERVMYAIAKGASDANAWLYRVDGYNGGSSTTATMTALIDTKVKYQSDYSKQALSIDYETGNLIWMTYSGTKSLFYELNPDTKEVKAVGEGVDKNFSGLLHWVPKQVKIEAKVKETKEPSGNVAIGINEGKVYDSENYYPGTKAVFHAYPFAGCKFVKWNDGNTQNPRTVAVTQDTTLIAEFAWADGVKAYPIWVGGKQVHDQRLSFNSSNLSGAIAAGTITYDPENNILTSDGVTMAITSGSGITIGEEAKASTLTVKFKNTNKITGTYSGVPMELVKADVKLTGDGIINMTGAGCGMLLRKGSKVTFEGVNGNVESNSYAIKAENAADNDKVIIRGSTLGLDGGSNASSLAMYQVSSAEWKYVTESPTGLKFEDKKLVNGSGVEQKKVSFKADLAIRCEAYEEGTGTFTMTMKYVSSAETFKDGIGWFKKDTMVVLKAKGETGFVFGRWMEDTNWGDQSKKDDWWKDTHETKKTSSNEKFTALFYAQPASNVTWYGISDGKFVQFKSREYGAGVIESTSDASSYTAGDCNGGYYYLADNTNKEIVRFSFSGVTKDKEMSGLSKLQKVATFSGSVTDMAYNYRDGRFNVVIDCDKKLYKIAGDKVEEVGKFITGEAKTEVAIVSIAIDGTGKKYVLSSSGILYTIKKEDTSAKEVELVKVGKTGEVGVTPGTSAQSLAFDHLTGALYWGEKSYLRLIDTQTGKSHIAADLRQKKGSQGVIRALHRRDRMVIVSVEIDKNSKDMGTVHIGSGEDTEASFFEGDEVTIVAEPAEGYEFDHWAILDDESGDIIKDASYTTNATTDTYVAYFKPAGEGIDLIDNGQWTMDNYKVLIDGNLYIIKGDKVYNVTGNRVK